MARELKSVRLMGRFEKKQAKEVVEYVDHEQLTIGEFLRKAAAEYILNHPITKEEIE